MRYRRAIASSTTGRPFDFNGNHLVIDFINTVNARPIYTRDDLATIDDVVEWAEAAGLLTDVAQVKAAVKAEVKAAATTNGHEQLQTVVALRENLYDVFGPIAARGTPSEAALLDLIGRWTRATTSACWHTDGSGCRPRWNQPCLGSVCDRLADEAMMLLRSPTISRLGACAGCGWLFVDTSRANARRWCSMNACGVRDKMRRYHQRLASASQQQQ